MGIRIHDLDIIYKKWIENLLITEKNQFSVDGFMHI